jgi:protein O-GlcNAc transferase
VRVISFCLWGDNPIYTLGAIKNAELALDIYPGWECWFYVGVSTPNPIKSALSKFDHCKVISMDTEGDHSSMLWRFLPASNLNVEIMISRDCDSRLNDREKHAVYEWVNSDKSFHIMRDHPWHNAIIMGGMWGAKVNTILHIEDMIKEYQPKSYYQTDQDFLRDKVYPLIKDSVMVHDEFFDRKPYPTPRAGKDFVGQAFNEFDEYLNPEHMDYIK